MRLFLTILFQLTLFAVYAQPEIFQYKKITGITDKEHLASQLYNKLDSFKHTRQPHNSNIETYFNRDIDFGYKHQRINLQLNGWYYQVNLLVKNDTVYLSSVKFDDMVTDMYPKLNNLQIDTVNSSIYLTLRNNFYSSHKSIEELIKDLNLTEQFASNCGDGSPKTRRWTKLERQAKNNAQSSFLQLLQSISCEEQEYGVAGFKLIEKQGTKLPARIITLLRYLKDRKSDLVVCSGCFTLVQHPGDRE
jgi:hypothetical protein